MLSEGDDVCNALQDVTKLLKLVTPLFSIPTVHQDLRLKAQQQSRILMVQETRLIPQETLPLAKSSSIVKIPKIKQLRSP